MVDPLGLVHLMPVGPVGIGDLGRAVRLLEERHIEETVNDVGRAVGADADLIDSKEVVVKVVELLGIFDNKCNMS